VVSYLCFWFTCQINWKTIECINSFRFRRLCFNLMNEAPLIWRMCFLVKRMFLLVNPIGGSRWLPNHSKFSKKYSFVAMPIKTLFSDITQTVSVLRSYYVKFYLVTLLKPVILSWPQANLQLGSINKFELIIPGNDSVAAGPSREITVPSNGAISVKFPIRANTLGEVPITVSATSELASDALTRVVYVRVSERFTIFLKSCHARKNIYM